MPSRQRRVTAKHDLDRVRVEYP